MDEQIKIPVPLINEGESESDGGQLAYFLEQQAQVLNPALLIIYGGGGHAKSLIDLIQSLETWKIAGIVDDRLDPGSLILGIPVLGGGEILPSLRARGIRYAVNAVGGIGDINPRLEVFAKLRNAGFSFPTVCHPRGFIEPSAKVGDGCQVLFGSYVGSDVRLGFGCLLNSGVILSHDCLLGDYVNISPGSTLAGSVTIGEKSMVGMGVTINLGLTIGAGVSIGNSAVIKADVPEGVHIRAGAIWPQ